MIIYTPPPAIIAQAAKVTDSALQILAVAPQPTAAILNGLNNVQIPQVGCVAGLKGSYLTMRPQQGDFYTLAFCKDQQVVGEVTVVSGLPNRKAVPRQQDYAGSGNPIPQGTFTLGKVWDNNFVNIAAMGTTVIPVNGTAPRTEILIHKDANRETSPGTAGCPAPINPADMEKIADFVNKSGANTLIVDHGFQEGQHQIIGVKRQGKESTVQSSLEKVMLLAQNFLQQIR